MATHRREPHRPRVRPNPPRFLTRTEPVPLDTAVEDALVRDAVIDRFTRAPGVDVSNIQVDVSDGVVSISGSVPHVSMKWHLEQLAAGVPGVAGVRVLLEARRGPADK